MNVRGQRWWCVLVMVLALIAGALALSWEADWPLDVLKARWAAPDAGSKVNNFKAKAADSRREISAECY